MAVELSWAVEDKPSRSGLPEPTRTEGHWSGPFGERYARQFVFTPSELDAHWVKEWGIKRSAIVRDMIGQGVVRDGPRQRFRALEVGCNVGNQLAMVAQLFGLQGEQLFGVDINEWASEYACRRGFKAQVASMRSLPFANGEFPLVFTCGVVSHIEPEHVAGVMKELARVSGKWVFGTEYSYPNYGDGFVWCRDHKALFLEANPGWRLVKHGATPKGSPLGLEAYLLEKSE